MNTIQSKYNIKNENEKRGFVKIQCKFKVHINNKFNKASIFTYWSNREGISEFKTTNGK